MFCSCPIESGGMPGREKEFGDFAAKRREGKASDGGGFRKKGGLGHAGYSVGFEDVGSVRRVQHDIDDLNNLDLFSTYLICRP